MLVANIAGAIVGGLWLVSLGLVRALLLFGVVQALANLGYFLVALQGHNLMLMSSVVFLDNFVGSMGNTALVVFIMGICDVRFSAFQYAAWSAIAVLPRNLLGAPAGILSDSLGWATFFVITFFTALPGLAMVWWQRARIARLDLPRG
jgi:PAT family beta-lactamase induction signal transducer AmpG